VARIDQLDALFDRTLASWGRVDVLVNNAYGAFELTRRDGDLLDVEVELWDQVMTTTLRSVFYATQRAVREMLVTGGGSIVNLSSVNGLFAYGLMAYSTAKGGIIAFTRAACLRYASRGIRMNVICPGTVATASTEPMLVDQEVRRRTDALYPRGSIGRPEEIAAAALYLASDESSFTNGAVLVVDGGLTVGPVEFGLVKKLGEV
jgi:NAD(P)-dependent dehydrogenase (short-subunit alcohol dehydrogenase family)